MEVTSLYMGLSNGLEVPVFRLAASLDTACNTLAMTTIKLGIGTFTLFGTTLKEKR